MSQARTPDLQTMTEEATNMAFDARRAGAPSKGPFLKSLSGPFRSRALEQSASRYTPAASAIAIRSRKRGPSPEFSTRVFPAMKWLA